MTIFEDQLSRWAKAPSETEEGKCQHTVERITKAVRSKFGNRVSIFTQGSYKNRTNVRLDSDVDVVVRLNDIYFGNVTALSDADKQRWNSIPNSSYTFSAFKNDVESVLASEFGVVFARRHDKCIQVLKNEQRVNADVVPCFVHKRFKSFGVVEAEGIEFRSDKGNSIISFPDQHYENGVSKNDATSRVFKSAARILKNVRNDLVGVGTINKKDMPSFFLECLVWNVPNDRFRASTYREIMKAIIAKVWTDMQDSKAADTYAEICDLHWLFRGSPQRTYQQATVFMNHAWSFLGF